MTNIDLIIFDCDGVLIDSELICAESVSAELAHWGMPLSPAEALKLFLGKSRREIATTARVAGYSIPWDFVERLESRIQRRFEERLRPIKGVKELLEKVRCPVCVASGSPLAYIKHALKLTHLSSCFEERLYSAAMVDHPKPAPDLFLHAAAKMNVEPAHCLVVEDSMSGIAAAIAAHMPVAGFIGGSHLKPEEVRHSYEQAGCEAVFDSMEKLAAYLKELGLADG